MAVNNEESSEQLARRLVAKITDDAKTGPLGGSNAKVVDSVLYSLAAAMEDLLKARKSIREADDLVRRTKLKTVSEVTAADLVQTTTESAT